MVGEGLRNGLIAGIVIGFVAKSFFDILWASGRECRTDSVTMGGSGEGSQTDSRVYDLVVKLKLKRAEDVQTVLEKFEPLRRYCNTVEKETTVTYEAFIDEYTEAKDTIVILERYTSLEALTGVHHKSPAFLTFVKWLGASDLVESKDKMAGYTYLHSQK